MLGDQPGAISWQRRALELFRTVRYRDREARVLNRLGDLSRKVGEVGEAERYFAEALPLAREVSDPATVADILNNSGLLMSGLGRIEEAIEQLQAAIPLARAVNSANVEGALWLNIGDAYFRLGVYDKAIEAFKGALEVVGRLNLPRRSARAQASLAFAHFLAGNRPAADRAIAQALSLYQQSGDRGGLAETLAFQGEMLYAAGQTDEALSSSRGRYRCCATCRTVLPRPECSRRGRPSRSSATPPTRRCPE